MLTDNEIADSEMDDDCEQTDSHGTHDGGSQEEDAHVCIECKSVFVRLKIPKEPVNFD